MAKELRTKLQDPDTGTENLAQAQRMIKILEQASAGTALITQLVTQSTITDNAKPILSAISASLEIVMSRPEAKLNDQVAWSMAALLAAYELGRMGDLAIPKSSIRGH